MLLAVKLD